MHCLLKHDSLVVYCGRDRDGRLRLAGFGHHVYQGVARRGEGQLADLKQYREGRPPRVQVGLGQEVVPSEHAHHGWDPPRAAEGQLELEGLVQ